MVFRVKILVYTLYLYYTKILLHYDYISFKRILNRSAATLPSRIPTFQNRTRVFQWDVAADLALPDEPAPVYGQALFHFFSRDAKIRVGVAAVDGEADQHVRAFAQLGVYGQRALVCADDLVGYG